MKWILNVLKALFKKKNTYPVKLPTTEEVEKIEIEMNELVQVIDLENNGSHKNPDWTYLITTCTIDPEHRNEVFKIAQKQLENFPRYSEISKLTGVPVGVIADIHQKECSLDFKKVLHNGQPIVGTNKKTTWVPKGRGPFKTFEEGALDALLMKQSIFPTSANWSRYYPEQGWTTQNILRFHQFYNGLGHQNKGLAYSPYIWAFTNHHNERGNYVSDGKYSSTAVIKNGGVMAYMIARHELMNSNEGA